MPAILLASILAAVFCLIPLRKGEAETPDTEIPVYVKGKQVNIILGNGDKLNGVTVIDVVLIHREPWWRVSYPVAATHSTITLTINPRQIQMLSDLP